MEKVGPEGENSNAAELIRELRAAQGKEALRKKGNRKTPELRKGGLKSEAMVAKADRPRRKTEKRRGGAAAAPADGTAETPVRLRPPSENAGKKR